MFDVNWDDLETEGSGGQEPDKKKQRCEEEDTEEKDNDDVVNPMESTESVACVDLETQIKVIEEVGAVLKSLKTMPVQGKEFKSKEECELFTEVSCHLGGFFVQQESATNVVCISRTVPDVSALKSKIETLCGKSLKEFTEIIAHIVQFVLNFPGDKATLSAAVSDISCILCDDGEWHKPKECFLSITGQYDDEVKSRSRAVFCVPDSLKLGPDTVSRAFSLAGIDTEYSAVSRRVVNVVNAQNNNEFMSVLRRHSWEIECCAKEQCPVAAQRVSLKYLERLKVVKCDAFETYVVVSLSGKEPFSIPCPPLVSAISRSEGTVYYRCMLPHPFLPSGLFSCVAELVVGHQCPVLAALLFDLCSKGSDFSSEEEQSKGKWKLCQEAVGPLQSLTLFEPVTALSTASLLGKSETEHMQSMGWDVTVYCGSDFNPKRRRIRAAEEDHINAEAMMEAVGREGEMVGYELLCKMYANNPQAEVVWTSQEEEGGLPYDMIVQFKNAPTQYYEVKATSSPSMLGFIISPGEWDFIREHPGQCHIIRILRATSKEPIAVILNDPHQLSLTENARLFLEFGSKSKPPKPKS